MPSFYHEVSDNTIDPRLSYKNTYYAMAISFENFIAKTLLQNDLTRVINSSTDYALVKRSGRNTWNNANLPFVNYKISGKTPRGNRQWFSNEAYSQGVFLEEIGIKVRMVPVSFTLDCTYWTGRDDDWQYATDKMLFEESAESKIDFDLDFGGNIVKDIGIMTYDLNTSPAYQEKDWLEKNNIFSFSINPTIQTFIMQSNTIGYCIPKTVLLNFLVKKKVLETGEEVTEYDDILKLAVDHINQTVTQEIT